MTDEIYFASKKIMQESATSQEAVKKLKELFTPEIIAEMDQKNEEYKKETYRMLNKERMKAYRDRTRKNKYSPRKQAAK